MPRRRRRLRREAGGDPGAVGLRTTLTEVGRYCARKICRRACMCNSLIIEQVNTCKRLRECELDRKDGRPRKLTLGNGRHGAHALTRFTTTASGRDIHVPAGVLVLRRLESNGGG